MLTPLVILGASGHASVVADIVQLQGVYQVVGCIDELNPVPRQTAAGLVLGAWDQMPALLEKGVRHAIVGIGDNAVRRRLGEQLLAAGFVLATAIHPRAVVAGSAMVGPGSVVMAGAVINPGVIIGAHAIINTCASVDHDCILGDAVHICPGTHLAGSVHVGDGTMIGIGSSVRDRVRIGSHCTIGAGSAIVSSIPDHSLAMGVPARVR